MRPGKASQTAVMVCMSRAAADGRIAVGRFSDPTALALLPDKERARVARMRALKKPRTLSDALFVGRTHVMVARTVAIDDAVRAASAPQVVILGAGLDGRAWRMPELGGVTVFEVDHPDSQRDKRARVAALTQRAQDVRFVPVDFTRDDLDQALAAAGHDPSRPTTWIWEGVVMYLTLPQIEATLSVVARRSAARSRLIIAYHQPAKMLWIVGMVVRLVGEPLRSTFTPEALRALLARHGFLVGSDESVKELGARLGPDVERGTRPIRHLRIATADRPAAAV